MKKLMMVALMACSLFAFADEPAKPAAKPAGESAQLAPQRKQLTPEQRKEFHEKMMAARKARQAEIQQKVTAVLKEAGLGDQQAKDAADKIEKIYTEGRRPMGPRHGGPRPGGRRGPRPGAPAPTAAPAK